jgi:hypothetical protein
LFGGGVAGASTPDSEESLLASFQMPPHFPPYPGLPFAILDRQQYPYYGRDWYQSFLVDCAEELVVQLSV